jgi:hypothetical protein
MHGRLFAYFQVYITNSTVRALTMTALEHQKLVLHYNMKKEVAGGLQRYLKHKGSVVSDQESVYDK